ncbi:hypothetical protein STHU_35480 [Allostella humosa]|nr:hypothetical protein STHU_35480 [Stella humosa]
MEILKAHGVDAVADVRSRPYSRFAPQFRRDPLRQSLEGAAIAYVFLGAELGARTDDPSCWCDGAVDYHRLAATPLFQAGLDRVRKGAADRHVALLCMERDPLTCHRCILVGRHLARRGLALAHIHYDGTVETGADADARLMRETGTVQGDVLAPDALARAYDIRGQKIAYRK